MRNEFDKKNPKALADVFEKFEITLPRALRVDSLRSVLKKTHEDELSVIEKRLVEEGNALPMIEYNRLHRLRRYTDLSELQLENDYKYYKNESLNHNYVKVLWDNIVQHLEKLPKIKEIMKTLNELPVDPLEKVDVFEYNRFFDAYFKCSNEYLDGVSYDKATEHFNLTSSKKELYVLGEKYGVTVPKYRNKEDLQNRLKKEYIILGKLDDATEQEIMNTPIRKLKTWLDSLETDSKSHITKEDIVEIIIHALERRAAEAALYGEVEVKEEAPVVQEVVEEKVEVVPVLAPEKEIIKHIETSAIDYSHYFEQIIKNQEIIIQGMGNPSPQAPVPKKKEKTGTDHLYNFIVITLILIVIGIWIAFAITTVF